jgi:hypothetical protein
MRKLATSLVGLSLAASASAQVTKGPSSSQAPYQLPTVPGARITSMLTAGDNVNGYLMAGLPDGSGAYDNGNGTFTFLVNHEMGNTSGAVHAHGSTGAFVSKWTINKSNLAVLSGADLIQNVALWNTATNSYTIFNASIPSSNARFSRFCSADLPAVSAFYNAATGLGTQARIFMNGEENGSEGRGMAHVVTGPNGGTSYELPRLGKFSYENSVANPGSGDKTIVAGTDDATPGQVYFYVGTKTATGSDVEKAGLTNGSLYSISVNGMLSESSASFPAANTSFTTVSQGNVQNMTGTQLESASNTLGVTRFLRPEDAAWDPANPQDLYFVTTNAINSPSRLWKVHFNDLKDLNLGGTITVLLDGTEGQKMLDNMTLDSHGNALLQEDVGGDLRLGKTWNYNFATDELTEVLRHDSTRFLPGAATFITTDEEASGIIDAQHVLGAGWFLGVDQIHAGQPSPIVEGGQLFAYFNPATYNAACSSFVASISLSPSTPVPGQQANTIYIGYGPQTVTLTASAPATYPAVSYSWIGMSNTTATASVSPTATTNYAVIATNGIGCVDTAYQQINVRDIRDSHKNKVFICYNGNTQSISVNAVPALLNNGAQLGGCINNARMSNEMEEQSIAIAPNPAGNTATITMSLVEDAKVSIAVVDMQGRTVINVADGILAHGAHDIPVSVAELSTGVYFIQVQVGVEVSKLKMVVAH